MLIFEEKCMQSIELSALYCLLLSNNCGYTLMLSAIMLANKCSLEVQHRSW